MILTVAQLKLFGDSVIFVSIVLLIYNLASLATTDPDAFQPQVFWKTFLAYVNNFIVVFFYWVFFSNLLNHVKHLNLLLILTSLIFLILVTLAPVISVALRQHIIEEWKYFLVQIPAGLLLFLMFLYVRKDKASNPFSDDKTIKYELCVIPSIYAISLFMSFFNSTLSQLIPFSILPLFVLIRIKFHKMYEQDSSNTAGI
jgi:uncharacterized membrane protein